MTQPAAIHYRIEPSDLQAHLFTVVLTISQPASQQEVSLPVWIPGSYLIREFSKNLQQLSAQQGRRKVPLTQLDKHRWQAHCSPDKPLVLKYSVCAYDNSVRTAWLDTGRGFFNGTSLCLRVHSQESQRHSLEIASTKATAHWMVATGLEPLVITPNGFGLYAASNYDELVDCPVEMGLFWQARFTACGTEHRFVVAGAALSFDGERLVKDTQKICEAAIRFWHGKGKAPHKHYLFMLNAVADGYGGLEHRNSTALICSRRDLPRCEEEPSEGYTTLLGLISHEYFHTWNVKRLRPTEFASYDYDQENYTQLLWFFEGFTSYYDDLLLRRAGLIDDNVYLKLVNKTLNQVLQTPGRMIQTAAQSSLDAWVKYYRQDPNTPNATVSYYTKGALIALCLDLTLRREGKTTLDAVMRGLWKRCAGGPMSENDLQETLQTLGGRSFAAEINAWVHSTQELPVAELLAAHGVQCAPEKPQWAQQLGLRVTEDHSVHIKSVLRGQAAERAGLQPGDEWLGVEVQGQAWRITKLDDVRFYAGTVATLTAVVARDGRLLHLPLRLSESKRHNTLKNSAPSNPQREDPADTVRLTLQDPETARKWLS